MLAAITVIAAAAAVEPEVPLSLRFEAGFDDPRRPPRQPGLIVLPAFSHERVDITFVLDVRALYGRLPQPRTVSDHTIFIDWHASCVAGSPSSQRAVANARACRIRLKLNRPQTSKEDLP